MVQTYRRITVIGATGSGKTTFARALAAQGGQVFCDLDDLHWLPGWQLREKEDFYGRVTAVAAGEDWVICGNYSEVRTAVWPRAEAIVWLDYPFYLVFWRLLSRSVRRIADQNSVCNGNTERLRTFLSKDSIMLWLFRSYWRRRRQFGAIFADAGLYPQADYIRLRSAAAAEKWLHSQRRAGIE
ncbi:MAG: adenylate kinase [Alphaproteobacteria bacterium]|nr:adenylate kinase [Alphaproteobacteria bacterium]